jgi:alpha-L-rhamnosidase
MFWSPEHDLVVDNLPRIAADGEVRLHDRTLSMALLYGIVPAGREERALNVLANLPTDHSPEMFPLSSPKGIIGFSFTVNACWRYWALSRFGRAQAVIRDLVERWGSMTSLAENNTFSEWWDPKRTGSVWAQNTHVPMFALYGEILGVKPTAPAYAEFDVRPQLGQLAWIEASVHAPSGPIHLRCEREGKSLSIKLHVPGGLQASLVFPHESRPQGVPAGVVPERGPVTDLSRWKLPVKRDEYVWDLNVTNYRL